jgi:hypothetical protein
MEFRVAFTNEEEISYSGASRYEIHDFGILVVTDEAGNRLHLSPRGWLRVEDQEPKSAHARMTEEPA